MLNAMTVDVEEYFQVSAFNSVIQKSEWDYYESRVCDSIFRILDLFKENRIKGTFFVLGWVANKHPGLIRKICEDGHEIASHGMNHDRVTSMTLDDFKNDLDISKKLLEDITGSSVLGFRAPSFSMPLDERYYGMLEETGYLYSSSIYPISHDHYGVPNAKRFSFDICGIREIPISTIKMFGRNFPVGGGGYFRLLPIKYYQKAIKQLNCRENQPSIFYFHPWEIDENQPKQTGLNFKTKFRHYVNINKTYSKLERLLKDLEWTSIYKAYQL